jgi:hypothetical protein
MATKSDSIRYTQLRQQIVDIYEKASAGITNENQLDKSVITALNDGGFDVFYGDQLKGLKPQKFDFILNPEDHPADHIDYYDGEVIDKPQQAMSWELYLDTYKTEDPYSVILERKKMEHTNPHIQQAKLGTMIKGEDYRKELYKIQKEIGKIYNECENEVDKRWGSFDFKNNPSALEKYKKEVDDLFLVKLQENGYGVFKNAKGVTLQKLDILLNGQDYPSVRVDYYNGVHIIGYRERLKQEEYFSYYPEAILVRKKQEQAKLGTNIKTKRMRKQTLSQKANYVPNRMINEVEVERNGKVTFVDGANILDGVYVKKGVKYKDGGQMNETFPDVDGKDNMSFMAGGKVGKLKLKTIADLVENEKAVKEFLTKKIKENYLKGATFKTDDYIYGAWEQDEGAFDINELIGDDMDKYVPADEQENYLDLVNAWRDGIAVKLGGSSRKINADYDGVSGDKRAKEIIDNLGESNDYNPGTKADLKKALTKYLAKKSKDIGDEDFQDILLNSSYIYGFDMDGEDGEKVSDDLFDMIENEESVTAIMKYLENVNKAKRGTTIKNKQMAESTTKRRFDKMYKASKPGERKSKKFAKIERADGTTFRRRNANDSYPDGVPGGKTYSEKRPNRTDKRIYLEQGGSLGEGMGTYESTLQSNIEMGEGIEMAKRGKKIPEYNREADKQFAAMGPGERTSKRFAKIYKKDGTYFRRKNANGSYPDGVPGGLDYTENRPNRSDKRIWLEDGGSLPMEDGGSFSGEGFTYEIGGL